MELKEIHAGDVPCFNMLTAEFEVWDHYVLCGRGLPDDFREVSSVSKIDLINEIRVLKGLNRIKVIL